MENQSRESRGRKRIAALEREQGIQLTVRQKEVVYRSYALGLTEANIDSVLLVESVPEQEYVIGCFLDGLPKRVIDEGILKAGNLREMRNVKLDFLSSRARRPPEGQAALLATRLSQIQLEKEQLEREVRQLRISSEEREQRLEKQQTEILEKEREIRELTANFMRSRLKEPERLIKETRTFQKPETFKERLRYLFGKSDLKEIVGREQLEERSIGEEACGLLCEPEFSIGQLLELQQGILDGLRMTDIRYLAKPDLSREKMKAMRRFLSEMTGCAFTDTGLEEAKEAAGESIASGEADVPAEAEDPLESEREDGS